MAWGWLLAALTIAASMFQDYCPPYIPRQQIQLVVGQVYALRLGWPPAITICDDLKVVSVEDGEDHVRLVGKAVGQTLCSFWIDPECPRREFEINVKAR